ncbi:MAG: glycosyltransferase family 8 protein [Devosia sp.]
MPAGRGPVTIASSVDAAFLPFVGPVAASIGAYASPDRPIDYRVFYSGPESAASKALDGYRAGPLTVRLIPAPERFEAYRGRSVMGTATLVRLAAPELMADLDRVVFIDVDLVVLADIGALADVDLAGNPMAAAIDLTLYGWHHDQRTVPSRNPLHDIDRHLKERIGLGPSDWYDYFNTGVAVLDLAALRREGFTAGAMEFIDRRAEELPWLDQDSLNILLKGRIAPLDPRWNAMTEPLNRPSLTGLAPQIADAVIESRTAPKIIHYAGHLKPWKRTKYFRGAGEWWHFANMSPTRDIIRADYRELVRRLRRLPDPRTGLATMAAGWRHRRARVAP